MTQNTSEDRLRNDPWGWVFVAIAAMMWGSDLLFRPKVLATGMNSVAVVMYEHIFLALIFTPVLIKAFKNGLKMTSREFVALMFIAWGGSGLATYLLTQAYAVGEPVTATLLQKLQPAFAISLAGPILRERPKWLFYVCFGVALVGAYLTTFGLSWVTDQKSDRVLTAALLAVGAAAIWGSCTVIGRWALHRIEPYTMAGLRFVLALPMLVVWNLLRASESGSRFALPSAAMLPLLAIVLIPDAPAMALYYIGLRRTTASLATLAELAYPATAVMIALLGSHDFSLGKWLGIAILIASLHYIKVGRLVRDPSPAAT